MAEIFVDKLPIIHLSSSYTKGMRASRYTLAEVENPLNNFAAILQTQWLFLEAQRKGDRIQNLLQQDPLWILQGSQGASEKSVGMELVLTSGVSRKVSAGWLLELKK